MSGFIKNILKASEVLLRFLLAMDGVDSESLARDVGWLVLRPESIVSVEVRVNLGRERDTGRGKEIGGIASGELLELGAEGGGQ